MKPDDAEVHLDRGSEYFEKGDYDQAIRQYEEAIRLKPDYAEVHFALGWAYFKKGDYDQAIGHFEEAIRLKPLVKAHFYLGWAHFKKGRDDQAIRHFEEAIRLDPDCAVAHFCLGLVWAYVKKDLYDLERHWDLYDLAIGHLDEATRLEYRKEAGQFLDDLIRRGGGNV